MFELKWANETNWNKQRNNNQIFVSKLHRSNVDHAMDLFWEEHCIECAVPECYAYCTLYRKRKDLACARFVYGIYPNKFFRGRYDFGADILFRRWGKLEASLGDNEVSKDYSDYTFVMECFSPQSDTFTVILEQFTEVSRVRTTHFRASFTIRPGPNYFTIPIRDFNGQELKGYIYLYPEVLEHERRLIFTWLDILKLKSDIPSHNSLVRNLNESPVEKIKCLAWDLDNTLWDGILSEDDLVTLRPNAVELIRELDYRGIIQTIVSKNDFTSTWMRLKEMGLSENFIFPQINWRPKSENLKTIAKHLNIDVNSFGVIDDSEIERAEIKYSLPMVRVYSDSEINELLKRPEFDVVISETTSKRRLYYLQAQERDNAKDDFSGDNFSFLASCQLNARVFLPHADADKLRCFELVNRSNQLNLSSRRYTKAEFDLLFVRPNLRALAISCKDKYGDYGIIGYSTLLINEEQVTIHDFVISCRVAQRKIEDAFFKAVSDFYFEKGYNSISIPFVPSFKNQPIYKVLFDLGLKKVGNDGTTILFAINRNGRLDLEFPLAMTLDQL